jgi:hypothetical protein
MSIDEAARATRSYFRSGKAVLTSDGITVIKCTTGDEAQAACDRMNLVAVLEAIMEPSKRMVMAADRASYIWLEAFEPKDAWLSMLAEKIAEVKEQKNA